MLSSMGITRSLAKLSYQCDQCREDVEEKKNLCLTRKRKAPLTPTTSTAYAAPRKSRSKKRAKPSVPGSTTRMTTRSITEAATAATAAASSVLH
jgi:hypothetical protein